VDSDEGSANSDLRASSDDRCFCNASSDLGDRVANGYQTIIELDWLIDEKFSA
jgi:hypothetical protein